MLFVGAGLMGSNWIILSSACLAVAMTRFVAIRGEARALVEKFGGDYRAYMRRTGRFVPRPRRLRQSAIQNLDPMT